MRLAHKLIIWPTVNRSNLLVKTILFLMSTSEHFSLSIRSPLTDSQTTNPFVRDLFQVVLVCFSKIADSLRALRASTPPDLLVSLTEAVASDQIGSVRSGCRGNYLRDIDPR